MTSRDLAAVVMRVIGVLLIVQVLLALNRVWGMYRFRAELYVNQDELQLAIVGEWFWIVVMMVVSGCLLLFADRLATLVVSGEQPSSLSLTAGEAQSIAFATVGLYLACTALPSLSLTLYRYVELRRYRAEYGDDLLANNLELVIENVIRLLLGLALFFGHRGLSEMWRRLQPLRQNEGSSGEGAP